MSTRISLVLLLVALTVHVLSAFTLKEGGEEGFKDGLSRRRMLQNLGSGYEFQAHVARVNGVRGYACSCTHYGEDVNLYNCFRQMNWKVNCIHI